MKPVIKKTKRYDHDNSGYHRLNNSKHHSDLKKRPTSRAISDGFRAGDERSDRVIETQDADLTDDIRGGPRDREDTERCRPQKAGNEEREDAAEVRREHRDRV